MHIKLYVGSENLDSEENKTVKEDRYHPDMSQTCLHIEFLRGGLGVGHETGGRWTRFVVEQPLPLPSGVPTAIVLPIHGLGPGLLCAVRMVAGGAGRLSDVAPPPGPPQSGPRWRRGVRVAWPVWHGEGQDASHWSRPRPRGPAPAPGMGPRQGL